MRGGSLLTDSQRKGRNMRRLVICLSMAATVLSDWDHARGDTFATGDNTFEFVTIGDARNPPDTNANDGAGGFATGRPAATRPLFLWLVARPQVRRFMIKPRRL